MGYTASFKLADVMGRTTLMRVEVAGADLDAAKTNAEAAAVLLQDITKLAVVSGQIIANLTVTPGTAVAGSNTDVGGKVKGISDDDGKIVVARVPDPIAAIVNSTGGFDLEEEHLAAWLAEFASAQTLLLSDGETASTWLAGELDKR